MYRSGRRGPTVPFLLSAAVAASFLSAPAAAASDAGPSATVPARTADPSWVYKLQAGGNEVVWEEPANNGSSTFHAWLSVSGGTPQDLGVPAESGDVTQPDVVSVQSGVLAFADGGPNADFTSKVVLRTLADGSEDTLPVGYSSDGGSGSERYVGQAGHGILVQQVYRADNGQYQVRLILRSRAADGTVQDRTLLEGDELEQMAAGDAHGVLIRRTVAPSWAYEWDYIDYATGSVTALYAPGSQMSPGSLEFTPDRVGYAEGGQLHEWSRTDVAAGPVDSALPVTSGIYAVTDDTILWQVAGDGSQQELWGESRDGSAGPAALGVSVADAVTDEQGRLRLMLETADQSTAIRTVTNGRVSQATGDTTQPVPQRASLLGMAMSGGSLYVADNSARLGKSLYRTTPSVGVSGVTATTDRMLTLPDGYAGILSAVAGGRMLLSGSSFGFRAFNLDGTPIGPVLEINGTVLGFDGTRALISDASTQTLRLHDFATGTDTREPLYSTLNADGTLVTATRTSTTVQVTRAVLATGKVTDLGTYACGWGQAQAVGDWLLLTGCANGTASGTDLLHRIGSTTSTTLDSPKSSPLLTATTVYTFTAAGNSGTEINARPLASASAPRALFGLPGDTSLSVKRWAVDPDQPWASWMDDDGVTHVVWAGAPTLTAGTVPTGFSPNGDGKSDRWTPTWFSNRPVNWTLALRSGATVVRILTGTTTGGPIAPNWDGRTTAGTDAAAGTYAWSLTATDTATKNAAPAVGGTVVLRRAVPASAVTAPALAGGTASAPDWNVTWSGKTAGVISYDLAYRTVRKSGSTWVLGPLTAWRSGVKAGTASVRSGTTGLRPVAGLTYRFYVRAHDDAGQTGAWSSAAVTAVPVDDRSTAIRYAGTWRSVSAASAWAGTQRVSAKAGATAVFTADGTQLRIVATKATDGGRFAVLVDGRQVAVVDTRASRTLYRQTVYTRTLGSKDTAHRVTIKVLSSSGSTRAVRLDAIAITR